LRWPQKQAQGRKPYLKQSEEFKDNHDNDNYSYYVEDVSAHTGGLISGWVCGGQDLSRLTGFHARFSWRGPFNAIGGHAFCWLFVAFAKREALQIRACTKITGSLTIRPESMPAEY
jgi:hypothetical protein